MGLFDSFKKKKQETPALKAFENGKIVAMKDVDDPTFAQEILGPGIAIEPTEGVLYAPCSGVVSTVADTSHAVSITADSGAEVLMHLGIDTVELKGQHFKSLVETGDKVAVGDKLVEFELDEIKKKGYKLTTPLIICNHDEFSNIEVLASDSVTVNDDILKVNK